MRGWEAMVLVPPGRTAGLNCGWACTAQPAIWQLVAQRIALSIRTATVEEDCTGATASGSYTCSPELTMQAAPEQSIDSVRHHLTLLVQPKANSVPSTANGTAVPSETGADDCSDRSSDAGVDSPTAASPQRAGCSSNEDGWQYEGAAECGKKEDQALQDLCDRLASIFGDAAADEDEW